MPKTMIPNWLDWAQRLQAIAQTGLSYSTNVFDIERYEAVREIAAEMAATFSDANTDAVRALFAGQEGHATPKVDVRFDGLGHAAPPCDRSL
jgi:hypothetical protein